MPGVGMLKAIVSPPTSSTEPGFLGFPAALSALSRAPTAFWHNPP